MLILPSNVRAIETNPHRIYYKSVNRQRDELISTASTELEDFLDEERSRVVKAVRGAVTPEGAMNLANHQLTGYPQLITALNLEASRAFSEDVLAKLPRRKDTLMELLLREYISRYVATRVTGITRTRREEIRRIVQQGIEEGLSIPNIAKLLDGLYLETIIPNRSEAIARTEVISASNAGSFIAAKSTGLPLRKIWLSTADRRTRDAHSSADGQTVDINEPFVVGGEKLMFPGDSSLGASGANLVMCRCAIAYEV